MLCFGYGDEDGVQELLLQFPLPLHNYSFIDLLEVAHGDVMRTNFSDFNAKFLSVMQMIPYLCC